MNKIGRKNMSRNEEKMEKLLASLSVSPTLCEKLGNSFVAGD
jgi:hypothetical protein